MKTSPYLCVAYINTGKHRMFCPTVPCGSSNAHAPVYVYATGNGRTFFAYTYE